MDESILFLSVLLAVGAVALPLYLRTRGSVRHKIQRCLGIRTASELGVLHITLPKFFHQDVMLTARRLSQEQSGAEPILVNLNLTLAFAGGNQVGFHRWWGQWLASNASPHVSQVEVEANEFQTVTTNQLYPVSFAGTPLLFDPQDYAAYGASEAVFQLAYKVGEGVNPAKEFAKFLREQVISHNRFRGKLVSLTNHEDLLDTDVVKILGRPPQEAPILGTQVEREVREALLDFMEHRESLKACGLSTKRGVLLVGPPGTGKTTIVRWLLNQAPEYTALLVRGESPNHIRLVFRLARALSPSLVLLEDVDLLATNRYQNSLALFLGALMTEMDGVEPNEDVVVLMTSNDPSEMEAALIRRPGRIDRIIEVGAPEEPIRVKLLAHFLPNPDGAPDLEKVAKACKGLMPAAIKEVVHQAALSCIKEGKLNVEGHPAVDTEALMAVVPRIREQFGELPRMGIRRD